MSDEIVIREATLADLPEILRQRRGMFVGMGTTDEAALDAMQASSKPYLERALADCTFREWLAIARDGAMLGGGAIAIHLRPTAPHDTQPRRAEILNVFTHPEHRRRGVARKLIGVMIEWCRREGFAQVALHASPDGRALYEELGFEPTNEMQLKLR